MKFSMNWKNFWLGQIAVITSVLLVGSPYCFMIAFVTGMVLPWFNIKGDNDE